MDVTIQSVNLQLPSSDIQFLKELANRMGWKANTVNSETSKTELDKAILDVKKGNVKNFDTLEEMMNYLITAKPKAHAFKNEMCFPQTKTKCELKKHSNSKFECFFVILIEQRPVYFFLFLPSRFKTTLYVCLNSKSEGCQLFNIFECV